MIVLYLVNMAVILVAVLLHSETLHWLSTRLRQSNVRARFRVLIGVAGVLVAHAVQVWIFAVAFYLKHHAEGWGNLSGNFDGTLADCVYYSFTNFTTLGTGDIEPIGPLRYLAGLEALTGLLLIAWSASFLYLEMTRHWRSNE